MTESLMERAKAMISIPENLNGSGQNLERIIPETVECIVRDSLGEMQGHWSDEAARKLRLPCETDEREPYAEIYRHLINICQYVVESTGVQTPDMLSFFKYVSYYDRCMNFKKPSNVCVD